MCKFVLLSPNNQFITELSYFCVNWSLWYLYNSVIIWMCYAKIVVRILKHSALPFVSCNICQNPDYYFGMVHWNCNTIIIILLTVLSRSRVLSIALFFTIVKISEVNPRTSRKSINNFKLKLVACFVLFDVTCFILNLYPGPATQTDPALCHCFCFVADVNISFELHFNFYFADVSQVCYFFLVNRSRLIIHFVLSDWKPYYIVRHIIKLI